MPQKGLGLSPRLRYLVGRARRIDVGSVLERAKESSAQHDKWTPAIVVDMLWQAGFRNVGFQDYIDYDFAILSRDERATYMTHPVSNQLSQKYDHPDFRHIFQDKIEFDRVFSEHLHREWMVVEPGNAAEVRAFARAAGARSSRRSPSARPAPACTATTPPTIDDWDALPPRTCSSAASCSSRRSSSSIPISPRSAPERSTRRASPRSSTASSTHILAMAQKFGRGAVSDQMTFGGFYTMLDENGHAVGPGYDSHGHVHEKHPDSGFAIGDFQLPMMDDVRAFIDQRRARRAAGAVRRLGHRGDAGRPCARRGQLGRGRVREQAQRHRHPHRSQGPLPRPRSAF